MKLLLALSLIAFGCNTKTIETVQPGRVVEVPTEPNPEPIPPIPTPRVPEHNAYPWLTADALDDLNDPEIDETRDYFYMTTFSNFNAGELEQESQNKGIDMFLNMISNESQVFRAGISNETQTLFRVDMDDIGMDWATWWYIEDKLKLPIEDDSRRGEQLRFLTGKRLPIVHADDFIAAVLQADESYLGNDLTYYVVTKQSRARRDFERQVYGDSLQDRINEEDDCYAAGGGGSPITQGKDRIIMQCEGVEGTVLDTWDVSLANNQSAFDAPFIPEMANFENRTISQNEFRFVAQETIFFKRNGFLGFRLNGAVGEQDAETIAPLDVVNDPGNVSEGLSGSIMIGSCAKCHTSAYLPFQDQLGRHIQESPFSGLEKDVADKFFKEQRFRAQGNEMQAQYDNTLAAIDMTISDPPYMYTTLINPLRNKMDAAKVAGYTGLTKEEFLRRLPGTSQQVRNILGPLLNPNGRIQLTDLQQIYRQLIVDMNLFSD